MLRTSATTWRLTMAGLAMLGLSACGSDSDAPQPKTDSPQASNLAPTGTGGIGSQLLNPDEEFIQAGDTVLFATDAHDLAAEAQTVLQRQAQWLQQNPARTATIQGHADERGTREYNLALGERRAESVRAYLVALGVDATRLQTISFGKEKPLCGEANEACWQGNRRGTTALNP